MSDPSPDTPNAPDAPNPVPGVGGTPSAAPSAAGGAPAADDAEAHRGAAPPAPDASNEAPDLTRAYTSADGRITVAWYASRCIHSGNCVRSLPRVFNPKRKPWVEPDLAEADAIAQAIRRCPSGALHYERHDGAEQEAPEAPTAAAVVPNGPVYLRGDVEVRAPDGTVLRRDTRVSLCRCGLAAHMPFCDNTCRATGWREPGGQAPNGGAPDVSRAPGTP